MRSITDQTRPTPRIRRRGIILEIENPPLDHFLRIQFPDLGYLGTPALEEFLDFGSVNGNGHFDGVGEVGGFVGEDGDVEEGAGHDLEGY